MRKILAVGWTMMLLGVFSLVAIHKIDSEEAKSKDLVLQVKAKEGGNDPVDASSFGNKLINHGVKVTSDPKFGAVLEFDGVSSWIEVPITPPLKISGDITWEVLVKLSEELPRGTLISYGQDSPTYFYLQSWSRNTFWEILDASGTRAAYGGDVAAAQPNPGWHLFTLVRSGNTVNYYVDGKWVLLRKIKKGIGDISPKDVCYHIGRDGRLEFYFKGFMAEVRVYARPLTEEEINERAKALPLTPIVD